MAGGEIYRVEIPIIVDDQTDKPLQQAEQKISKLEQHARKENERMRQHFMKIAKLQIEPIMKVRDHLTSGVSKADRLIRNLDAAQAAPLLAAQDKVSVVVTKINAMLDALDKGKVDVAAEMKGPLLDEIAKAKSSLAALDNVKAGPVAELRGELFGQLTKAMSQIKGLDLTRAEPQATLRERITMKVREIGSSLRSLTARAWDVTLQVKDKASGVIKNVTSSARGLINILTSPLALLGAGAGIGAGIFFPLKLAGEFEQAQMSLDFYMGGVEEGKKAFEDLVRFAKETPFEFPFLQGAVIQLMGAGYDFEEAKRALLAFGDAAGRTGAGMQGIEMALLGFTQIASAGTLNLQDLKQVALNLKLPLNMFAEELGVAEDELGNIGSAGISSAKAMEAIVKTLEQRFAGGMKELSNSLLGMTAVIKDTAQLTVWHFGKGMAGPVKRILMDIVGLTDETGGKFEEFQRRLEQVGEAVGLKFEQAYIKIKELWGDLSADPEFQQLDFGGKIIYLLNLALDEVSAWLDSEGGMRLQETFMKIGEIGVKAWMAGLKGAFEGAASSAASGNLMGTAAMLGLVSVLGGGKILRGVWGLGKGLFGVGKWALGKLGLGIAGTAATGAAATGAAATGAATTGTVGILGKTLVTGGTIAGTLTGVAGVISGAYDIYRGYKEKEADHEEATKRYWAGGTKLGMVGTGAAIGTAIAPGIGTAIGAGIGGIAALLGGTTISETFRNVWEDFLSRSRGAWWSGGKEAGQEATAHAVGGILTRPHLGLVAEAGPEAIIPLSVGMRARALALYEETGRRLGVRPYAEGGILTRPHLGLVAEAGPEAIIPLSARMRARAMDLWLETGRRLGVRPYAEGGFAGALTRDREQKIPVSFTPSLATLGPATINLNFDLTGLVRQVVIENREDIDGAVDRITDAIANNLRSVFQNMTK